MVTMAALTGLAGRGTVKTAKTSMNKGAQVSSWTVETNAIPAVAFSVPEMPELTFSNKLSGIPIPSIPRKDYYQSSEYYLLRRGAGLRAAAPYVPDIFYEMSKRPYAERMAFMRRNYAKIAVPLEKELDKQVGKELIYHVRLTYHVRYVCQELLYFGRPVVTLPAETQSVRQAVDLCGLTQLGKWMDLQKAKNREFNVQIPDGYDEQEAMEQKKHFFKFERVYGEEACARAMGLVRDNPISPLCPYYTAKDFAHLTPAQRKNLLDMFKILPESIQKAPISDSRLTVSDYREILADKTGYQYIHRHVSSLIPEAKAIQAQKLSLEILTYGQPLILLKGKEYTLEQMMYVCRFRQAENYHRRKQGKKVPEKQFDDIEKIIYEREANALISLGKKFKKPEWSQFGESMLQEMPTVQIALQKTGNAGTKVYYTESDFAHLPPAEREELEFLLKLIPQSVQKAPRLSTKELGKLVADETGSKYVRDRIGYNVPKEKAEKIQKLCMEILTYGRPLALIQMKDCSLEEVISEYRFWKAKGFYNIKKMESRAPITAFEDVAFMPALEANAIIALGQKFNHPDWVEFGREMCEKAKTCELIERKPYNNKVPVPQNKITPAPDSSGTDSAKSSPNE